MPLIIVESPTKARTIKAILGKGFEVVSSYGHVRDLPKTELGIDVEHDFAPTYVIPLKARPHVKELRAKAQDKTEVILATDEDREGEAIAYHIEQILQSPSSKLTPERNAKGASAAAKAGSQNSKRFKRIAFHEITPEAITEALKRPRDIDLALVDSQKARRVLDRLVGYKLSPLLWKKIVRGISAGRVQSVALRIVAMREAERAKFVAEEYWTIEAKFAIKNGVLTAALEKINGKKLDKLAIKTKDEAEKIKAELERSTFLIEGIEVKPLKRSPEPPFITSTLQQTAGIRLGMGASVTMSVAQKLYETGKITYMRTDAFTMAQSALERAKTFITGNFGKEYSALRQWKTKAALAQEAHEAIRPTDFSFTPEHAKQELDSRQSRLYTLIWQRALASQMSEARFEKTKVSVASALKAGQDSYTLQANGSRLLFDGFTKVYPVKLEDVILPEVQREDTPLLQKIIPAQHFTQPPPRFSEATLIKTLKDLGIGRPSTYAPTVDVIQKRRYVEKDEQRKLKPTDLGMAVSDLLTKHFPDIVDFQFTARMEEQLDEIAEGKESSVKLLNDFYEPFAKKLAEKQKELQKGSFGEEKTDRLCPQCSSPVIKKLGRFGPFYSCSRFPECKWAEQIKQRIGMKCPTCKDGDVIERRTKKGRIFYGCSAYPKCTFASWQKPKEKKMEKVKES